MTQSDSYSSAVNVNALHVLIVDGETCSFEAAGDCYSASFAAGIPAVRARLQRSSISTWPPRFCCKYSL